MFHDYDYDITEISFFFQIKKQTDKKYIHVSDDANKTRNCARRKKL